MVEKKSGSNTKEQGKKSTVKASDKSIKEVAEKEIARIRKDMQKHEKKIIDKIKKNPGKATLIAAGVGAGIGAAVTAVLSKKMNDKKKNSKK